MREMSTSTTGAKYANGWDAAKLPQAGRETRLKVKKPCFGKCCKQKGFRYYV